MEVTAGETTVAYRPNQSRIVVESGGSTLLTGRIGVRLAAEGRSVDADGSMVGQERVPTTEVDGLVTTIDLATADGAVDVTLTVENRGEDPVRLAGLDLVDGSTTFGPDDRVFEHGYQSWTPTATLELGDRFPPESDRSRPQMVDLAAPRDARTSHGVVGLAGKLGTLTLGFLDHERFLTRFDLATDAAAGSTALTATCPADGIVLDPGESLASATLRIDATRALPDALAAIADAVADRMDARVPDEVPTGWCSWYHYFTDVTAAAVRANVDAIRTWDPGIDVVQLDDGYEAAFGDWRTLAEGFEDMRGLRNHVADAGYTPGIWVAPFYVQADSRLAADHPEWLVTEDGDPVDAGARHGPMYALDTTHPGVQSWLRETFETIVEDWGLDYCKLDFLYAAALPGDRYDDVTRAQAYRRGLETIREAIGDTFVLGCGAPGFPSVGLVDAMRIGPDTAPYWRREGESASQPAHENAVRNVLNRQVWHRRLWVNDPDCQLVRSTSDLTTAERQAFATLVALSGGSNFVSDAVGEIDAGGRRLFERTLPAVEGGTVPDLGTAAFPERITCERPADGAVAVARFNWSDEPRTVQVDPTDYVAGDEAVAYVSLGDPNRQDSGGRISRDSGDQVVDDPAAQEDRIARGSVEAEIPPHGTLVVHCSPSRDRPHLVGSPHLANAASQVTDVTWDSGTLAVDLDADRPMDLVVATPGTWRAPGDGGSEATVVTVDPGANRYDFDT